MKTCANTQHATVPLSIALLGGSRNFWKFYIVDLKIQIKHKIIEHFDKYFDLWNKNTHVKSKVLTVSQKRNYKPSKTQLREHYSKNAFEQGIESLQHNTKTVIASDSMRCNCM